MPGTWPRFLLHHDPDAAANAEGFRAVLGEAWAHQAAVVFHTTGALVVAGALAAVLYLVTVHHNEASPWSTRARRNVRTALFVGWVINFLGGVMRLYEPDHPGLSSAPEVAWVNAILIKHLALLAAVGFSVLAVELGPATWRARPRANAVIALALVLVSSLIGGVASGLPLGHMEDDSMVGTGGDDESLAFSGAHVTYQNSSIPMTATPVAPSRSSVSLEVPQLVSEIWVGLEWTLDQSVISAELWDPSGEVVAESGGVTATTAELSLTRNIIAGQYTIVVRSSQAVQETVSVTARITQGEGGIRVLSETVTVAGLGFEINMYMDPGEWFTYEWSVASGEPAVVWDIHSHPGGQVVVHESGTATNGEGNFTAGEDEIYSIYWQPAPGQVVTLTYRLEGPFRVHSIFRGA